MFFRKKPPHLTTGRRGERLAALYLRIRGYRILERNFLCPGGELDIVAGKGGLLVFVEVRTRKKGALVDPLASLDDRKMARFIRAARHYLWTRRKSSSPCRFDIITIREGGPLLGRILHLRDAFRTTDEGPRRALEKHGPANSGRVSRTGR